MAGQAKRKDIKTTQPMKKQTHSAATVAATVQLSPELSSPRPAQTPRPKEAKPAKSNDGGYIWMV